MAMSWTMNPRKSEIIAFAIKRYKLLLVIFVVAAIVTSVIIFRFAYNIPEEELARDYILTSQVIQSRFGKVLLVKRGVSGAKVSYSYTGRVEGSYTFVVEGEVNTGEIRIRWHSKGSGEDFTAESMELLEPWKDSVTIWSADKPE